MDLSSLLFGSTSGSISQGDLDALNAELHQLENAGAGRGSITAPAAGLFTSTTDGYESLTPDMLENLTPDGVDALERTDALPQPASAIGKLVTAKKWYFASVMNKADADRLNLNGSASLDFPQHYNGTVSATVMSKSEPDSSGKVAVVFACNAALADTLAMRKTTADVVYSEHTGLRVPLKAVHMDDDGQSYRLRRHGGAIGEKTDRDHLSDRRLLSRRPEHGEQRPVRRQRDRRHRQGPVQRAGREIRRHHPP